MMLSAGTSEASDGVGGSLSATAGSAAGTGGVVSLAAGVGGTTGGALKLMSGGSQNGLSGSVDISSADAGSVGSSGSVSSSLVARRVASMLIGNKGGGREPKWPRHMLASLRSSRETAE